MDTKALDPASGARLHRTLRRRPVEKRTRKGSFRFQGGRKKFLAVEPWPPVELPRLGPRQRLIKSAKDAARCLRNLGTLGALLPETEDAEAML